MSARNTFSIPTLPSEFDTFQNAVVPVFVAKATLYGIPPLSITNITASKIKWDGLSLICDTKATHSPGATANRNKFQPDYYDEISTIINEFLLDNELVTAEDALIFHIHPMGGGKTPLEAPIETVKAVITYKEPLTHYFSFYNGDTNKRAKPVGVSFVEIRYLAAIVPPASIDECIHTVFMNKKLHKILFTSADEGKKAFYFGRYVNKNGDAGPWGAMFSAGIV